MAGEKISGIGPNSVMRSSESSDFRKELLDEKNREMEMEILEDLRNKINEFGRAIDKTGAGWVLIDIGLHQYDLEKSFVEKNIEELEELIVKFNILLAQSIIIARKYKTEIYREIVIRALDVSAVLAKMHLFALATEEGI